MRKSLEMSKTTGSEHHAPHLTKRPTNQGLRHIGNSTELGVYFSYPGLKENTLLEDRFMAETYTSLVKSREAMYLRAF